MLGLPAQLVVPGQLLTVNAGPRLEVTNPPSHYGECGEVV